MTPIPRPALTLDRLSTLDAQKLAVFVLLAREGAKWAEAIPSLLIKGKAKFWVSNVMNADRNLLLEIEHTIKEDVRQQLRQQKIDDSIITARQALAWGDYWEDFEQCSEILSFVMETLVASDQAKRTDFLMLCKAWVDGEISNDKQEDGKAL